jgi:glycosyltransferase involved in cell wall biosynthesis
MIFIDVTKSAPAKHRSGLTRVTLRLAQELEKEPSVGTALRGVRPPRPFDREDWYLTAEVFAPSERPDFAALFETRPCRFAAIFHDTIPLRHPAITWPQSVARHPHYLSMLARFDRVLAVSEDSKRDLLGFWKWQGVVNPPPVDVLQLGADGLGTERVVPNALAPEPHAKPVPTLLCLGIIEPRKNQLFLCDVAEQLWAEGLRFELQFVGRVNPHFGKPILARITSLARKHPDQARYHGHASDEKVVSLYRESTATLFPSMAEGCGLPVLESLWQGVPCLASDLPSVAENAKGGGCLLLPSNDPLAWAAAIRDLLTSPATHHRLATEAASRPLPTWANAAAQIEATLV